jgi:prevent-host-death family protein
MRKTSLANAKAHLSELVDAAEHHNERIIIMRHGKPVAALVPIGVVARKRRAKPLDEDESEKSVDTFIRKFSACEPGVSAVDDLIRGRR